MCTLSLATNCLPPLFAFGREKQQFREESCKIYGKLLVFTFAIWRYYQKPRNNENLAIHSGDVVKEHSCEGAHKFIAESEQNWNVSTQTRKSCSNPGVCVTYHITNVSKQRSLWLRTTLDHPGVLDITLPRESERTKTFRNERFPTLRFVRATHNYKKC